MKPCKASHPLTNSLNGANVAVEDCTTKPCSKCGAIKPLSEFHRRVDKSGSFRKDCKACRSAMAIAYASRNNDSVRAYKSEWRATNRLLLNEKQRARYRRNPKRGIENAKSWGDRNRAAVHAIKARWKDTHPEYSRADAASRRAAKLRSTPAWANIEAMRAIYRMAVDLSMTVDHIVPLRSKLVCGLHCEANLQLLPLRDNIIKSNRTWPDMP